MNGFWKIISSLTKQSMLDTYTYVHQINHFFPIELSFQVNSVR